MSDSTTRRDGKTKFAQSTKDTTKKEARENSVRASNRGAVSNRDLRSTTNTSRASSDRANIAFVISFSVPILGRFPTAPGSTSC